MIEFNAFINKSKQSFGSWTNLTPNHNQLGLLSSFDNGSCTKSTLQPNLIVVSLMSQFDYDFFKNIFAASYSWTVHFFDVTYFWSLAFLLATINYKNTIWNSARLSFCKAGLQGPFHNLSNHLWIGILLICNFSLWNN